jgi:hypothetical protein
MKHNVAPVPLYGDFKAMQDRHPGLWKKTKAYELLKLGKIRAKRVGGRTAWDLTSADEYIASCPDINAQASA